MPREARVGKTIRKRTVGSVPTSPSIPRDVKNLRVLSLNGPKTSRRLRLTPNTVPSADTVNKLTALFMFFTKTSTRFGLL